MSRNGKNNKGGRPKGKRSQTTLEKEKVLFEIKQRTMKIANRIFDAQLSLALGQQFLYKIHTNSKGIKERAELIENEFTVRAYLNGDLEKEKDDYYFITTRSPDGRAIDSIFDRTFGKSSQPITGESGEGPIQVQIVQYSKKTTYK